MEVINIHQAKTHLSQIIDRVTAGESVILGKAGKPVAVLSPYIANTKPRRLGILKGKVEIADDFDSLDEEIIKLFEGRHGTDAAE